VMASNTFSGVSVAILKSPLRTIEISPPLC
jgi:hypothetical protein